MGIFDRFRRKDASGGAGAHIVDAVRRAMEQPSSSSARAELREALGGTTLLLAVAALPAGIPESPAPLEEDTQVSVLTSMDADGQEVLLAFTSADELAARTPGSAYIGLGAEEVFGMVMDAGYAALIFNPAGAWLEVRRDDIPRLLAGR